MSCQLSNLFVCEKCAKKLEINFDYRCSQCNAIIPELMMEKIDNERIKRENFLLELGMPISSFSTYSMNFLYNLFTDETKVKTFIFKLKNKALW